MDQLLVICGVIASIGAAIAAIDKWIIKPINSISKHLDKVDQIERGQKRLMKAQAQTMEHLCSGNNIEELKKEYKSLLDFCIDE